MFIFMQNSGSTGSLKTQLIVTVILFLVFLGGGIALLARGLKEDYWVGIAAGILLLASVIPMGFSVKSNYDDYKNPKSELVFIENYGDKNQLMYNEDDNIVYITDKNQKIISTYTNPSGNPYVYDKATGEITTGQ